MNNTRRQNRRTHKSIYVVWTKNRCSAEIDSISTVHPNNVVHTFEAQDDESVTRDDVDLPDDVPMCTHVFVPRGITKVFVVTMWEDGGGGSYKHLSSACLETTQEGAIEQAATFFSNEHNQNKTCEKCAQGADCTKSMKRKLCATTKSVVFDHCVNQCGVNIKEWELPGAGPLTRQV